MTTGIVFTFTWHAQEGEGCDSLHADNLSLERLIPGGAVAVYCGGLADGVSGHVDKLLAGRKPPESRIPQTTGSAMVTSAPDS